MSGRRFATVSLIFVGLFTFMPIGIASATTNPVPPPAAPDLVVGGGGWPYQTQASGPCGAAQMAANVSGTTVQVQVGLVSIDGNILGGDVWITNEGHTVISFNPTSNWGVWESPIVQFRAPSGSSISLVFQGYTYETGMYCVMKTSALNFKV